MESCLTLLGPKRHDNVGNNPLDPGAFEVWCKVVIQEELQEMIVEHKSRDVKVEIHLSRFKLACKSPTY